MTAYLSLFGASFLAATLVPFYSEVAVVGMVATGYAKGTVLAVATAGNTLGAVVNWLIGRYLLHFREHRWFPVKGRQLDVAQRWFQRWGSWSLLLAWAPVGGDALTFIAGVMRVRFEWFLLLVTIGKAGRYAVLVFLVDQASPG